MTRDEIIAMAREAAARHGHTLRDEPEPETVEFIVELVAMAAAKEREACAIACDAEFWHATRRDGSAAGVAAGNCASAIRARGQ